MMLHGHDKYSRQCCQRYHGQRFHRLLWELHMTCDSIFALGNLFSGCEVHQGGVLISLASRGNEDRNIFSV